MLRPCRRSCGGRCPDSPDPRGSGRRDYDGTLPRITDEHGGRRGRCRSRWVSSGRSRLPRDDTVVTGRALRDLATRPGLPAE